MNTSPSHPKAPAHWAVRGLKLLGALVLIGSIGLGLLMVLLMNVHWAAKPKDKKLDADRAAASRLVPDSARAPGPAAP